MPDSSLEKLEQAYRELDYLQPLKPDDPRLAHKLTDPFLKQLARELKLLKGRENRKMLLHGHVGCGKSTLLNCLEADPELNIQFLVVPLFVKDVSDPDDIEAIDIMFGAITATLEKALSKKVKLDLSELKKLTDLYLELKGLLKIEEAREEGRGGGIEGKTGVSIPSILQWLKASFQADYRMSFEYRKKVRQTFAPKMGQLIEQINATLTDVEARLGSDRRILFLVHDTDKPRIDKALNLFDTQGYQLGQLRCMALFVIDKAVACSGRFPAITTRLGAARTFPAFKIAEPKGSPSKLSKKTRENTGLLASLLKLRLPEECVDKEAFSRIVELGGGHFRETLRIGREAVFKALDRGSPKVDLSDVDYAGIQRANEFTPTQEQWDILKEVNRDPYWSPKDSKSAYDSTDSPVLQLLNGVALMEYTNEEEKWLRPHPVLIERIKRRS